MAMIIPEVILQRALAMGMERLKANEDAFKGIFAQYASEDEVKAFYGADYIDKLWTWFQTTKIPVIQAWSFNADRIPCISIRLANETEDEGKAAVADYLGQGIENDVLAGPVTVTLDIGLHANKEKDYVIWIYYIVLYILYREKMRFTSLGLQLHTYSASDYNREAKYSMENVWVRWVRFKCTVLHTVNDEATYIEPTEIDLNIENDRVGDLDNSELVP